MKSLQTICLSLALSGCCATLPTGVPTPTKVPPPARPHEPETKIQFHGDYPQNYYLDLETARNGVPLVVGYFYEPSGCSISIKEKESDTNPERKVWLHDKTCDGTPDWMSYSVGTQATTYFYFKDRPEHTQKAKELMDTYKKILNVDHYHRLWEQRHGASEAKKTPPEIFEYFK